MGKGNVNLRGQKFGRWNIVDRVADINGYHHWLCKCDCGTEKEIDGYSLTRGMSTSCGCFKAENLSLLYKTHGQSRRTAEYNIWGGMIQRCTNEKNDSYPRYGGRGIKVCDRWAGENGFENFYFDMGPRPGPEYSLDRYPNNETGDYGPENCRWATKKEQARNVRNNRWLEYNGVKMIMKDWADKWGITPAAIIRHLNKGESFDGIYNHFENKNVMACPK